MNPASAVSPFMYIKEEEPWVVWKRQEQICRLPEISQIPVNLAAEEDNQEKLTPAVLDELPPISPPKIQRVQYMAVMDKMARANRHTGHFSSWNPSDS